jgi:integrase
MGEDMSNKRRRIKGIGSVYTRKDGRVVGQYEINGKTRYIYGRDEKQVADRVAEAIKNRDSGINSENMTVGGYLDKWLTTIKDTVRIGTWKQYEMIVRLHIKPTLGGVKLDKLNALQVQSFYRERLDAELSPRRVQYAHVTIRKALKDAVKWRLIPYNVADAVTPPRPAKPEITPLSAEQVKVLLAAARGNLLEALYVLAVTTGMRIGEMFGLKWQDVDLSAGTLQVRRTVAPDGTVNPPKTASSRRTVRLSGLAIGALSRHQVGCHGKAAEWFLRALPEPPSVSVISIRTRGVPCYNVPICHIGGYTISGIRRLP